MISWMMLAAPFLLLHSAPHIIVDLVFNACRVILLLLRGAFMSIYHLHASMAAKPIVYEIPNFLGRLCHKIFGALWVVLDLPNYIIEMWMSERDGTDNLIANAGAPSVVSSADVPTSASSVASSLWRPCAGFTVNGSPCKRQKMVSNGTNGI